MIYGGKLIPNKCALPIFISAHARAAESIDNDGINRQRLLGEFD